MPLPLAVPAAAAAGSNLIPALIAGGTALSGVAQFMGGITGANAANKNYKLQKENLEYQKKAQEITWQREDNAVQRRAQDLAAAGLSKTLAAGSAAQTMAPIRTEAPQIDTQAATAGYRGISDAALTAMNAMAQKAQIDKTIEENKLIRLQQDRQALENNFMSQSSPLNIQNLQQEVEFAKAANPARIARMNQENIGIGIDNRNKQLDTQLKALGIDTMQVELIGARINNEAKSLGLDQQKKDLIAKQLAIEIEEIKKQNMQFNQFWYTNNKGLPVDFNFGQIGGVVGTGGMVGQTLWNAFQNFLKRR